MRNYIKLILIGLVIISIIYFVNMFVGNDTIVNINSEGNTKIVNANLNYKQLTFNNRTLNDDTQYLENNVCYASKHGFEITVENCNAQDLDAKEIKQNVKFAYNGTQARNISFIFIYEGELEKGDINLLKNISYIDNVASYENAYANNQIVDFVSYTDLGTPNINCQIGNTNNTKMYSILLQNANSSVVYCFTSQQIVNSTRVLLSGNYDKKTTTQVTRYKQQYVNINDQIDYLGKNLLGSGFSFYKVQNAPFTTGKEYKTEWIYTPKDKRGKWNILGYETEYGLINSINDDKYIYLDPWWGSSWGFKKAITIGAYDTASIGNLSVPIKITYDSDMQADFDDLRFLDAEEDEELGFWFNNNTYVASTNVTVWVKMNRNISSASNTTIYMYYGNPSATGQSSIYRAFDWADDFNDTLDTNKWNTNGGTASTSAGKLVIPTSGSGNAIISKQLLSNYIVTHRTATDNVAVDGYYALINAQGTAFGLVDYTPWITVNTLRAGMGAVSNDTGVPSTNTYYIGTAKIPASGVGYSQVTNDTGYVMANASDNPDYRTGYIKYLRYTGGTAYVDWVYVRPYTTIDPVATIGAELTAEGISVTLNSPATSYNTNNANINFNFTINPTALNITNWTFYIWYSNNSLYLSSQNLTVNTNNTLNIIYSATSISDNNYIWNVYSCGRSNTGGAPICSFGTNRTFTIDTIKPVVNINVPTNNQIINTLTLPFNTSLNSTASDTNLLNCWYSKDSGVTNTTFTCNTNLTNVNITNANQDYYIYVFANDTASNMNYSRANFSVNYYNYSVDYESAVTLDTNTSININLAGTKVNTFSAILEYNNTNYTMSGSYNNTYVNYTYNLLTPVVSTSTKIPFRVYYTLNGFNYTTNLTNQTVSPLENIIVSTSCNDKAIRFNLLDEQNYTNLNGSIKYNIFFGSLNNNTLQQIYGTISNTNVFYLCVNATASNFYNIGYGEFQYSVNGYSDRRYYLFSGIRVSNSTYYNISLYSLVNADSTSFLLTTKDTSLTPYVNHYITVLRWYPDLNTYNIVEMGKTDDKGRTVFKVQTEDVDYRIGIYTSTGTLIKLINPVRMVCLAQPCSYDIAVAPTIVAYSAFANIQSNLSYNNNTKTFTYIYSDPSQATTLMNLTVYKISGTYTTPICSSSSTSFSNVLTCDVSAYSGDFKAEVYRSASPAQLIAQLFSSVKTTILDVAGGDTIILLLSLILLIFLVLIGAYASPVLAIVLAIVALIPSFMLGSIPLALITAIGALGGIVIHFLKKT